jgi:hypothetical protein
MKTAAARIIATAAFLAGLQRSAAAHALAQRYDLPLPLGYFLLAAGAAVAATFVILALTTRRPKRSGSRISHGRILARGTVPAAIVVALQTVSVALFFLIVSAGLFGHHNPFKNLAPVAVWVIWWVGMALLSAFVVNIWALLNPFVALFDFAQWLAGRCGGSLSLRRPYPSWLGAWPACALFLLFVWLELVAPGRDVPRNIAIAMLIYFALSLAGFVAFGRDVWLRSGDVFAVVFELFGRFAPLHFQRDHVSHWSLRAYASGLRARVPLDVSMIGFTLLVLGSVTVDGVMETPLWASIVETIFTASGRKPADGPAYMLLASALLIAGPLVLSALYLAAIGVMKRIAGGPGLTALAGAFVLSLVPIAIAYHLAHYFSLLAIAGQFIIPLASDPFGFGWDLFGTMLYRVDIGIVDARFVWYLSVVAIVTGHIIAVWLAHIAASRIYKDPAMARRSQYPMLLLMVGYTMLSLWILAQPIVSPNLVPA